MSVTVHCSNPTCSAKRHVVTTDDRTVAVRTLIKHAAWARDERGEPICSRCAT